MSNLLLENGQKILLESGGTLLSEEVSSSVTVNLSAASSSGAVGGLSASVAALASAPSGSSVAGRLTVGTALPIIVTASGLCAGTCVVIASPIITASAHGEGVALAIGEGIRSAIEVAAIDIPAVLCSWWATESINPIDTVPEISSILCGWWSNN